MFLREIQLRQEVLIFSGTIDFMSPKKQMAEMRVYIVKYDKNKSRFFWMIPKMQVAIPNNDKRGKRYSERGRKRGVAIPN